MVDSMKAMEFDFSYLSTMQLDTAISQGFMLKIFP